MTPVVIFKKAGQTPHTEELFTLVSDYYFTEELPRKTWGSLGQFDSVVNDLFMVPLNRAEGYLYDENGFLVACVVYSRVLDIHYGLMAKPVITLLHSAYRNRRDVLRLVAKLRTDTALLLDTQFYEVAQHIRSNIQRLTVRRNNGFV